MVTLLTLFFVTVCVLVVKCGPFPCDTNDCNQLFIYPETYSTSISFRCKAAGQCDNLVIYASSTATVSILCTGEESCNGVKFYCGEFDPPGAEYSISDMDNGDATCDLFCESPSGYSCNNTLLSCQGTISSCSMFVNDGAGSQSSTLECNVGSNTACYMNCNRGSSGCLNNQLKCHRATTGASCECSFGSACSQVTTTTDVTYDPTAAITNDTITQIPTTVFPTTNTPTTSTPTTAAPITSTPSTVAPTTSVPSTSMPTTSIPTTTIPTTVAPTTSVPSTSRPTTSIPTLTPTTPIPTTSAPTTSIPSTSIPITSIPITSAPSTHTSITIDRTSPAPTTNSPITVSITSLLTTDTEQGGAVDDITTTLNGTNASNENASRNTSAVTSIIIAVVSVLIAIVIVIAIIYFVKRNKKKNKSKLQTAAIENEEKSISDDFNKSYNPQTINAIGNQPDIDIENSDQDGEDMYGTSSSFNTPQKPAYQTAGNDNVDTLGEGNGNNTNDGEMLEMEEMYGNDDIVHQTPQTPQFPTVGSNV